MAKYWLIFLLITLSIYSIQGQESSSTEDFIVEAFVSNTNPYVGEQILYIFRYFVYVAPPELTDNLPDFEGFWLSDIYELSGNRVQTINSRQYIVYEIYAEISALQTGEIIIAPSTLNVPETVFRSGIHLATSPIVVNVKSLPPGAPEEFTGAIGQFNAEIQSTPSSITLGQPITMTITIDGTGALERLPAPKLPSVEGWRVYGYPSKYIVSPIGGLRFGQKIFEWLLIPERAGSHTFPSIVFASFDPQLNEYYSTVLPSFTVEVFPSKEGLTALSSASSSNEADTALKLKPLSTLSVSHHHFGVTLWIIWLIPPGIFTGSVICTVGRRVYLFRKKRHLFLTALETLRIHFEEALKMNLPQKTSQAALEAILKYLNNKLGTDQLHLYETINLLQNYDIREDLREALEKGVAEIEGAQYIPSHFKYNIKSVVANVYEVLVAIDQLWQYG